MARMPSTPRRNPNDPPDIETDRMPPIMPEQRVREPDIAPPPSIEVDDSVRSKVDERKRPWTPVEQDWYYICTRVKRTGGFVKGLVGEDTEKGKEVRERVRTLMAKYGTKPEEGWKKKPHVPRLDNASHAQNQKKLFEKPVTMITVPSNPGT